MFGFVVAGFSLIGLIALARTRRRHGGWGGYWVFRKLDTSPGQEKVIRTAFSEARVTFSEFREQNRGAKKELAQLLEAERLDEQAVDAWLSGRQRALDGLRPKLIALGKQVHDVLDPEQRVKVARFVASGGMHHHGGCHGHYGRGHCC
jgi:Spy/CpxP family protein refolding chaperone